MVSFIGITFSFFTEVSTAFCFTSPSVPLLLSSLLSTSFSLTVAVGSFLFFTFFFFSSFFFIFFFLYEGLSFFFFFFFLLWMNSPRPQSKREKKKSGAAPVKE